MRELKFRAWDGEKMYMPSDKDTYIKLTNGRILFAGIVLMQNIGLKDKNKKEIFEDDLLRIKMQYMGRPFEGIFLVETLKFTGLSLYLKKLINPDSALHTSISVKYGSLCTDYRNQNYDRIAVEDTWGDNLNSRHRWREQKYSNNIEIIGNKYENPELLK